MKVLNQKKKIKNQGFPLPGSPIHKWSPKLADATTPKLPTRAAAPSLVWQKKNQDK